MNIHILKTFLTPKNIICLGLVVVGLALSGGGLYLLWHGTNQACLAETPPTTTSEASGSAQIVTKPPIYIDVSGAITNPGLYQLETGDRMAELIKQAGGFNKTADPQYLSQELNLAKQLKDGDKIYIPTKQEASQQRKVAETGATTQGSSSNASKQSVSINSGSLSDLDALPGIGEKRAQDIIDNRPYAAITELVDKKIVSQTIFDDIVELIRL